MGEEGRGEEGRGKEGRGEEGEIQRGGVRHYGRTGRTSLYNNRQKHVALR